MNRRCCRILLVLSLVTLAAHIQTATAYPQFQEYSQKHSGKMVNCAMCHAHPDGPEGMQPGQLGSLSPEEKTLYENEQDALDPGQDVDSPVLNAFGNHIIKTLGRLKLMELAKHPEDLAPSLGFVSDLDGDGIPDAREYLEGTNPVDAQSGNPWRLFLSGMVRHRLDLFMTLLITVSGIYGLNRLSRSFSRQAKSAGRVRDDNRPGHA